MTLALAISITYGLVIGALFAFGINGYVLLARRGGWRAPTERDDARWPHVAVQIPVYNERDVVTRILRAAGALEYPGRLEIQLLDDSDDDTTAIAAGTIAELRERGLEVNHVRRAERVGFKAGALAHAVGLTDAEVFALFDADFVPPPDFLLECVPLLAADDIAGVQTRWGHLNRDAGPLTRGQALGIDLHFAVEQRARSAAEWVVVFNGTGGVWKREAIIDAGGWSDDTLTEDLDLSYRAWLRGWRVVYADAMECPAEIPESMLAFKAQQRRWARGSTSTARKLLGRVWRSNHKLGAKIQATLHLTHYGVHPLMLASAFMVVPLALVVPGPAPWWHILPPLAMATGGVISMAVVAGRERGLPFGRIARDVGAMMVLGTGLAMSNTVAVFKGLRLRPAVFERTAKSGGRTTSYLTRADGFAFVELAGALVCAVTAAWLLTRGIVTFVPFLVLYTVGLGVVGTATLRETMAKARPDPESRPALDRAVALEVVAPGSGGGG